MTMCLLSAVQFTNIQPVLDMNWLIKMGLTICSRMLLWRHRTEVEPFWCRLDDLFSTWLIVGCAINRWWRRLAQTFVGTHTNTIRIVQLTRTFLGFILVCYRTIWLTGCNNVIKITILNRRGTTVNERRAAWPITWSAHGLKTSRTHCRTPRRAYFHTSVLLLSLISFRVHLNLGYFVLMTTTAAADIIGVIRARRTNGLRTLVMYTI